MTENMMKKVEDFISRKITTLQAEQNGTQKENEGEYLHMVLKGATEAECIMVARMIAERYIESGILPGNNEKFIEVSALDLLGMFLGESAVQTVKVINKAAGGVLLVKDAYRLMQEDKKYSGMEALGEIIRAMEERRNDLMIIFSGNKEAMEDFLAEKKGIGVRIPKENELDFEIESGM